MTPTDFRAAFTTAEGWGSFTQKRDGPTQRETVALEWGKLRLRTLAFTVPQGAAPTKVTVAAAAKPVDCTFTHDLGRVRITLAADVLIEAGQGVEITIV